MRRKNSTDYIGKNFCHVSVDQSVAYRNHLMLFLLTWHGIPDSTNCKLHGARQVLLVPKTTRYYSMGNLLSRASRSHHGVFYHITDGSNLCGGPSVSLVMKCHIAGGKDDQRDLGSCGKGQVARQNRKHIARFCGKCCPAYSHTK